MVGLISGMAAAGDPTPKAVDVKAIRDKMLVLTDANNAVYVISPDPASSDAMLFFSSDGKTAYRQRVVAKSTNGDEHSWSFGLWAPRLSGVEPASIMRRADGTYERFCGNDHETPLKEMAADKSKPLLAKLNFLEGAVTRLPHLLARDDAGVYYYIDELSKGKGFRVFVGKKGSMKEVPLTDTASDTGGEVYSTKSGDVRIVKKQDDVKSTVYWIKGDKKVELVWLDVDANSPLIYGGLGIYGFLGTTCEEY
jgi:DNA-binding beta-propeller fold protein YncE